MSATASRRPDITAVFSIARAASMSSRVGRAVLVLSSLMLTSSVCDPTTLPAATPPVNHNRILDVTRSPM